MSQLFSYQSRQVRTINENNQIWFAAKDICAALDISWSSATLKPVQAAWQGVMSFITPSGKQKVKVISEPAVYKLAFRSNKPEADAFTNWVASEVLPAIRKTGKFEAAPLTPEPDAGEDHRRIREDIELVTKIMDGLRCRASIYLPKSGRMADRAILERISASAGRVVSHLYHAAGHLKETNSLTRLLKSDSTDAKNADAHRIVPVVGTCW